SSSTALSLPDALPISGDSPGEPHLFGDSEVVGQGTQRLVVSRVIARGCTEHMQFRPDLGIDQGQGADRQVKPFEWFQPELHVLRSEEHTSELQSRFDI